MYHNKIVPTGHQTSEDLFQPAFQLLDPAAVLLCFFLQKFVSRPNEISIH